MKTAHCVTLHVRVNSTKTIGIPPMGVGTIRDENLEAARVGLGGLSFFREIAPALRQ